MQAILMQPVFMQPVLTRALWLSILVTCLGACGGEAVLYYRGTVAAGARSGHTWSASASAPQYRPVGSARVQLDVVPSAVRSCRPDRGLVTASDAQGAYRLPALLVPATIARTEYALVCVSAPGFDSYVYRSKISDRREPKRGVQRLNIRLAPSPVARNSRRRRPK